jgi:glycosyltransferase involved in cell wall biosynthesis
VENVARYDYLYVASGEPHKNHRCLVQAWEVLATRGSFPSLCLTLDPLRDKNFLLWVEKRVQERGLKITNQHAPLDGMVEVYAQARALIYPSLFESFGLPLLEAQIAGLPIIAAERDYVRDVVQPQDSFDPESALSIARAVLRRQGVQVSNIPCDASTFLLRLKGID